MLESEVDEFSIEGSFSITAVNFVNNTLTYSRSLDHYQYRQLKRKSVPEGGRFSYRWREVTRGPLLDRVRGDKMFMCIGLHQLDMGGTRPKIIVVAIRGADSLESKVTVEFHSFDSAT